MSMQPATRSSAVTFVALGAWLLLALIFSVLGFPQTMRPPLPQLLIVALVVALGLAGFLPAPSRRWLRSIPLSWLIGLHLTRFVGFYFLVLYGADRLPFRFAVPGGIGDIVAASGALYFLLRTRAAVLQPMQLAAWNLFGLIDILWVVIAAARCALSEPGSMAEILVLPLSLLPTFLVPLVIFSHVVIFWRLAVPLRSGEA